jgi:iron-sulfur cluster assembly protein
MIQVTELAIQEIQAQANKRNPKPKALRLGIRGGGCSGFEYLFEWSDKNSDGTDIIFLAGTFPIFVDPKSWIYLDNSILDFKKTLVDRGFYWQNPNQTGSCGCGKSIQF